MATTVAIYGEYLWSSYQYHKSCVKFLFLFIACVINLLFLSVFVTGVMDSPVLARCCRSLIGCRQCVDLFVLEGQACVKCRSAISRESIVVVAGLSEVLNVIKALDEQYSSA